jgi:hypothetical protein
LILREETSDCEIFVPAPLAVLGHSARTFCHGLVFAPDFEALGLGFAINPVSPRPILASAFLGRRESSERWSVHGHSILVKSL